MKTKVAYKLMEVLGVLCFLFIFNNLLFAQGGNNCITAALSPITIPFSAVSQTVTGKINDYNSGNITLFTNFPATYVAGEDYLYYFTASITGTIIINVSNISVGNRASLLVYKDCPNIGTCIASSYDNNFAGAIVLTANIKQGSNYYIMLDGKGGYNYNISVNYINIQPACTNMDFEAGNFTGWTGTNGRIGEGQITDKYPNYIGISVNTSPPQLNIVNSGTDACGGFPKVCPGGTYSAMIGDGQSPNYHGAQLIQSFQVTPSNSAFFYKYAMVVQDAGHPKYEQPYIRINMYDENGDTITCGQYLVIGGPSIPDFYPASCGANIYYRPWTTVTTDLSAYIGQTVTVIFTQADCSLGGHWSYAYIDCSCNTFSITESKLDSCSPVTLSVPSGFSSYHWSPGGQTTQSITVTSSGNYCCDLISVSGCILNLCKNVVIRPYPVINANTPSICNGSSTTLSVSGTNSYTWSNSSTATTITVTPTVTTTYTITGMATTGCTTTYNAVVNVVQPNVVLSPTGSSICLGYSGNITVSGALTYTWNTLQNGTSINVTPNVTTTYYVTGTDASGCTNTAKMTVVVNPNPVISASGAVICRGSSTTISASGGNNYIWSNSQTSQSIIVNPTSTTTYFVTGTDLNGCSNTAQAVVTVNANPVISANGATICNGSSTTISASGSNNYIWNNGLTTQSIIINPTSTTTYFVTGTDLNGCSNTAQAVVTVNANPVISASGVTICNGSSATISASGGNNYIWSNSQTSQSIIVNPTSTTTYFVTGANLNGCFSSAQAIITVNPNPVISATGIVICRGNSATISASDGNNYIWSNGLTTQSIIINPTSTTNYFVTGTDLNGCSNTAQAVVTVNANPVISANGATICNGSSTTISASGSNNYIWNNGLTTQSIIINPTSTTTYFVAGTDLNGCSNTAQAVVTVNANPVISASGVTICNGSSATISASGGNNYIWSNSQTGQSIIVNPTATTNYFVTGIDANGCSNTAQAVVFINSNPSTSNVSVGTCKGNNVNVSISVSNGGGSYAFRWQPTVGIDYPDSQNVFASPTVSTSYTVSISDQNGCKTLSHVYINIYTLPKIAISDQFLCFGRNVTLNPIVSEGTPPYTFYWTPNNGLSSTSNQNVVANPTISTTYTLVVQDSKSCMGLNHVSIKVNSELKSWISNTVNATCGNSNGSATVVASGGTPYTSGGIHYNYKWNTPNSGTFPTVNNLLAGTYTATITDSLGCTSNSQVALTNTPPVLLSTNTTSSDCGNPSGSATVIASGGTPPFTYLWNTSPQKTTTTITNLVPGIYEITVTDSKGCQAVKNVIVADSNKLKLSFTSTSENCDRRNGTATVIPSGESVYSYLWNNGETENMISNLSHNKYTVTVTSGTCIIKGSVTINNIPGPEADFTFSPSILDIETTTIADFMDLSRPGGNPIIKWYWNFGDNNNSPVQNPSHNYTNIGTYTIYLVVTDKKGCVDTAIKNIIYKDIYTVYIPNAFSPNDDGLNDVFGPKGNKIDTKEGFLMIIYNRWGEIIYKTNDYFKPWNGRFQYDGEIVQIGTYAYKIQVKELDGPSYEFIGRVSVIR
ncbi:MAG: gliding motility-associated C-terminal domain-containing protein [Bacteroidales bacterium]|jgi:gliding motility-associated-like protein